jgi:hypothetical protein
MKRVLTPSLRKDAEELLSIIYQAKTIISDPGFMPGDSKNVDQLKALQQSVASIQARATAAP